MSDLIQLGLDSPICLHTYSTVIQIPTESNTPTDLTAPELFDPFGETETNTTSTLGLRQPSMIGAVSVWGKTLAS